MTAAAGEGRGPAGSTIFGRAGPESPKQRSELRKTPLKFI